MGPGLRHFGDALVVRWLRPRPRLPAGLGGPVEFDFGEPEPGKMFEAGMVTNLECLFGTLLVDTIIYRADGTRVLSTVPRELLVATP